MESHSIPPGTSTVIYMSRFANNILLGGVVRVRVRVRVQRKFKGEIKGTTKPLMAILQFILGSFSRDSQLSDQDQWHNIQCRCSTVCHTIDSRDQWHNIQCRCSTVCHTIDSRDQWHNIQCRCSTVCHTNNQKVMRVSTVIISSDLNKHPVVSTAMYSIYDCTW